jgi:23S rRNA pseudouridine1911/1915/1917 synthase
LCQTLKKPNLHALPNMQPVHTVREPQSLLAYVLTTWPEVKRTKIKQWLKHGAIQVNQRSVTKHDHALKVGDRVQIQPSKPPASSQAQVKLPEGISLLHEDEEILVIHKPAHLLTIATDKERLRTAYHLMTDYLRDCARNGHERLWIVHRLDRETSGILLFAKTEEAQTELQAHWQEAEKSYLAIVEGSPPKPEDSLVHEVDESQAHRVYIHSQASHLTRTATTSYRLLGSTQGRSLLHVQLGSGRRHQIRVQLAHCGCPIVGDKTYGAQTNPARRVALHAHELRFTHPVTEEPMHFTSPLPAELRGLLPGMKGLTKAMKQRLD